MAGDKQHGCIISALASMQGGLDAADELAHAVTGGNQRIVHHGTMKIVGSLPHADRYWPAYQQPDPDAIFEPIITRGLLEIDNQGRNGRDGRDGQNGFALKIIRGIGNFQGPVWGAIKWMYVDGSGTTDGGKNYSYGRVCDMYGEDVTDDDVSVFHPADTQAMPDEGQIVPFWYDMTGQAAPLSTSAGGGTQRANATLNAELSGDADSVSVTLESMHDGSAVPIDPNVTAFNNMGFAGPNASPCKVEYNRGNDLNRWELYMVKPAELAHVMTDFDIDDEAYTFSKTRHNSVRAWTIGSASPTTVHTGTDCD